MLRILFTAQDVLRVRVLPSLGPMAETLHSLAMLRRGRGGQLFEGWRRQVQTALGPKLYGLGPLLSDASPSLGLLRLSGIRQDMEESVAAIMAADRDVVQAELEHHFRGLDRVPAELRRFAADDRVRAALLNRLDVYHREAIAPVWKGIRAHLYADRVTRSRTLLDRGVDGLLATLHPDVRWESMTLHLPHAGDHEIQLGGRGITVAPSFFLRTPGVMVDAATDGCTLTYPARLDLGGRGEIWAAEGANRDLANLLGRTRSLLLTAIAGGYLSTAELALRAGTSSAAVSQHTKVLREAGLILTMRHGQAVRHTLTPRGSLLLDRPGGDHGSRAAARPAAMALSLGSH